MALSTQLVSAAPVARREPAELARHLPGLDLLRGVAALLVFVCHLTLYGSVSFGRLDLLTTNGRGGVLLFFVISGFLVYRPFAAGPVDVKRYLVRRFLRIYPVYVVALVGTSILLGEDTFARHPLSYLLFLQNFDPALFQGFMGVSWTLQLEVTFYLLLPLIALVPVRRHPIVLAMIGIGSLALALGTSAGNTVQGVLFPMLAWAFVPGMVLAYAAERHPTALRFLASPAALAAGVLAVLIGLKIGEMPSVDWPTSVAGFFLVGFAITRVPSSRFLGRATARAGVIAAALSYGFYLWHEQVILALQGHLGGFAMAAAALVFGVGITAVSFVLVERPGIHLARALTRRRRPIAEPGGPFPNNPVVIGPRAGGRAIDLA